MRVLTTVMLGVLTGVLPQTTHAAERVKEDLFNFSKDNLPPGIVFNFTQGQLKRSGKAKGLEVHFSKTDWPNVTFNAPENTWDWSAWTGLAVQLYNPSRTPVDVAMRVDNAGADGWSNSNSAPGTLPSAGRFILQMRFKTTAEEHLWGMRGVPLTPPRGEGNVIDPAKIVAFQVFLPKPLQEHTLIIERVFLFRWESPTEGLSMPFIDRFGQYIQGEWPGKVHHCEDLKKQWVKEAREWKKAPVLKDRDRWGGWSKGPKLAATGWFRAEKIRGKWWLVTPDGTLFFSTGLDCVGVGEQTFVEQRDAWFESLPKPDEPEAAAYGQVTGAHSNADVIGGKGRTFSFYRANLIRKYGAGWEKEWRNSAYLRMKHWGFNTLGNWSEENVAINGDIPYTMSCGLYNAPKIEASVGYWSKMMDVYAPAFETEADRAVAAMTAKHKENPCCIGYFVDNELAWEGVKEGVLASPGEQPARQALVRQLTTKYRDIAALNTAWQTSFNDWNALTKPAMHNTASDADMSEYLYTFALRYFSVLQAAIHRHAPHQLYLGCRFAGAPEEALRACAAVADVVSLNLYWRDIPKNKWCDIMDKPAIIGEFHFGALDRGMFHGGLVRTANQKERAASYVRYLKSVADHPLFVGCHWFQYIDEPSTGRWFDGENYNIGFLTVTDTPYPEMVKAAKEIHAEIYPKRYKNNSF